MNIQKSFPKSVFWFLAGYILITYTVLAMGENAWGLMLPEDHYFENVGAGSLFIASVLFFYTFWRSWRVSQKPKMFWIKQLFFLFLGILFFFGAGEEISWGQRILNIETPTALNQVNTQNELNVHNITVFQESKYFTVNRMFDVFWFTFAVLVPLLSFTIKKFRVFAGGLVTIVPLALSSLFVLNYFLAQVSKIIYRNVYTFDLIPFAQAVQEIKESNYSLLFIIAGLFALWELRSIKKGDDTERGLQTL